MRFKLNKRGDTLKIIIRAGLFLLIVFLLLHLLIGDGFNPFRTQSGNLQSHSSLLSCCTNLRYLNPSEDNDGDGCRNECDFCEGGDDKEDPDKDGIPSACDVEPHLARTSSELDNLICKNDLYTVDTDGNKLGCCLLNPGDSWLDNARTCKEIS